MTDEELKIQMMKSCATVQDLIEHLQKNFKPTDHLCFWDEGGAWMSCQHVPKNMLGDQMFKYVKDDKKRRMETYKDSKEKVDEDFEFVDDQDVIVY